MADRDDLIRELEKQNDALRKQTENAKGLLKNDIARARQSEIYTNNQRLINEYQSKGNELTNAERNKLSEIYAEQERINENLRKGNRMRERRNTILKETNSFLKMGTKYLMESDKIIKSTNLTLGLSAMKADAMRASFEQSAGVIARLGGGIEDAAAIQLGYAEETGRARALTVEVRV